MTTVEIEDVLSSIRRLVSEDLRPTHKLVSAALQKGAAKLILTPALRVVADVRSALPDHSDTQEGLEDPHAVLGEIEAETELKPAEILPVFGSVRQADPAGVALGDAMTGAEPLLLSSPPQDANFLATAMSRINGLSGVDGDAAVQAETIEAVVAAVGAAVGPDEWEPDGGEPAPQAKAWADTVWNSDDKDPVPSVTDQVAADTVEVQMAEVPPEGAPAQDAEATQDSMFDVAPHDLQEETTLLLPAMTPDRLIGADSIVFLSAAPEDSANPTGAGGNQGEDDLEDTSGFISEDLLREIVRDMIREELQGSLGERITRNVRKLVRAEISRALAARDFDDIAHRG